MSVKKKKKTKTAAKKKRTTKKKARRTAKAKTSSTKRAGRHPRNEYDSWTGAAPTANREIFNSDTKERLDLNDPDYRDIKTYLPPNSADDVKYYFVARVATVSKKLGAEGKEVLKLFGNNSWNQDLSDQLEEMEFTKVGGDIDHLISDEKLHIDPDPNSDSVYKANSFVELFRNLVPGKLMARVIFTKKYKPTISAFWCWGFVADVREIHR